MTHLSVVVRWGGGVVAEALVPLRDGVCLGDAPGAVVHFPGATLHVRRDRFGWTLSGHRLLPGKRLVFDVGGVELAVEPHEESPSHRALSRGLDLGLALGMAALVLLASSLQAAERIAARNPTLVKELQARLLLVEPEVAAPVEPVPTSTVEVVPVRFDAGGSSAAP